MRAETLVVHGLSFEVVHGLARADLSLGLPGPGGDQPRLLQHLRGDHCGQNGSHRLTGWRLSDGASLLSQNTVG